MNAPPEHGPQSWLSLIGSPITVLGPSRGAVPDLGRYRIAYVHLSPHALWLFGSVTGMPESAECNGQRLGLKKFDLTIEASLRELVSLSGQPALDPVHDDSNHSFQLALPVAVSITKTDEPAWPDADAQLLELVGASSHLRFRALTVFIGAYGGKHARKKFGDATAFAP